MRKKLTMLLLAVVMVFSLSIVAIQSTSGNITAKASTTVDVTDQVTLHDWNDAENQGAEFLPLCIGDPGASNTMRASFPQACWNDNGVVGGVNYTANGNQDILEYIYINERSVRAIVTENASTRKYIGVEETTLGIGGVFAPIQVDVSADFGLILRILNVFIEDTLATEGKVLLTYKQGLHIYGENDTIYTFGSSLTYAYKDGSWSKRTVVEATSEVDVTASIGMTNQKETDVANGTNTEGISHYVIWFGENSLAPAVGEGEIVVGATSFYVNDHPDVGNMDWMRVIYINGVSARSAVTANKNGETSYTHATFFPMTIGSWYAPVCVIVQSSYIEIYTLDEYVQPDDITITLKAGFRWVNTAGQALYITEDKTAQFIDKEVAEQSVVYLDENGDELYRDQFEVGASIDLRDVPEKSGYVGSWVMVDGSAVPSVMPDATVTLKLVYSQTDIDITEIQFRTDGTEHYFFLRFDKTDYTTANQSRDPSFVTNTNLLDKVFVYFTDGAYTLRELWDGQTLVTYKWGDTNTLAFKMKDGIVDANGIGAVIEKGAEIPLSDGSKIAICQTKTIWRNGVGSNTALNSGNAQVVTGDSQKIPVTLNAVHIREGWVDETDKPYTLFVKIGEGSDWYGKGEALPTQAKADDNTTTYAGANWWKIYLANFTSKIKLHVKETDTWVTLGSILDTSIGLQWVMVYNGWGEDGAIRIQITREYNGQTVDKILFEKGCELPSYNFNGNANLPHTVHLLEEEYLFETENMDSVQNVNWTRKYRVTFDGENEVLVSSGNTVEYPFDLSEEKTEDENYYYLYNWYLNGEIYDFSTPITGNINLTSDGTFTAIEKEKPYTVTFNYANGLTSTEVEVLGGNKVERPEDPTKRETKDSIYEFIGWYNGEELYDFDSVVEENLTLTAIYREVRKIGISDLYDGAVADEVFKSGEIEVKNGNENQTIVAPIGYYSEYNKAPSFELSFDFKYTEATTYSTFTVQLKSNKGINDAEPFLVGWKLWFYRPGNPIYFQYLKYDESATNDVRVSFKEEGSTVTLVQDTVYTVKLTYRVIDAASGTVEMTYSIGDWSTAVTYELGAEYFNTYSPNAAHLLFRTESTDSSNANLAIADVGLIGKARQDIVLMNGNEQYLVDYTNQIVLPSIPVVKVENGLDQIFVGWTTDNTGNLSNLYPAGYKLQLEEATTLYAVWLGFEMQEGAAVRLAAGSSGIRFLTDIDRGGYQLGVEKGLIAGVGTFIVPTTYLTKAEFTHAGFTDPNLYSDIVTDKWRVEGDENATWTYAAALVNISGSQYSLHLSARGYLKINFTTGEGYVYTGYTEEINSRSIYDVATSAYNDTEKDYKNNATILEYVDSVADLSLENGVISKLGVGNYTISYAPDGNKFTVTVNSDKIKTALINGVRMTEGYERNIKLGDFVYAVGGFGIEGNKITFSIGAAENIGEKLSDGVVYFDSSDDSLDFFLNDYFKRHAGNYFEDGVDQNVGSVSAGFDSEEFFWWEWFSLAYYPISSMQDGGNSRIEGLREKLSSVPVDDYGYVWQNTDAVRGVDSTLLTGEHRMGWPFPTADSLIRTEELKTSLFGDPSPYITEAYLTSWDFNGADRTTWSSNIGATVGGGLFKGTASGASSVNFVSPTMPQTSTIRKNGITKTTVYNEPAIYTYYSPLLELDVRMSNADNVKDIIVYFKTNENSTESSISVNEYAFIKYDYSGKYEHMLYLPMYAHTNWGSSKTRYVTDIRIEIVPEDGKTLTGDFALNYVRPSLDTRHYDNIAILISALRQDYDYTGDIEYLEANITRARKAINFLMQAYNADRNLIDSRYLVGHDSDKSGNSIQNMGSAQGNGYWDISFMPEYDFHTNTYFYMALTDLAHLESVLESKGRTVDKSLATVQTANRNCAFGTSAYNYTSASLTEIAGKVQKALQATTNDSDHTGFWDATDGRFVAGYSEVEGRWYDYGYVAWNMEAIYYGVATEAQAESINDWISGKRTVAGDTSTGEDIYFFELAPRANTYQGESANDPSIYAGFWSEVSDMYYGIDQVQNGGAIMYTSYYDLMNRISCYGADNAYERLQAIQAWYMDIYEYYTTDNEGAAPDRFYWDYYENSQWDSDDDGEGEYWRIQNGIKGIEYRGGDTVGIIGIDGEFLESFLPVASIYYGFFGIESIDGETLRIAPNKPTDLEYWAVENLTFCDVTYDVMMKGNAIQIYSISDAEAEKGLSLEVVLTAPSTDYKVYVNGVETDAYSVLDGKIYVSLALDNAIIEIR